MPTPASRSLMPGSSACPTRGGAGYVNHVRGRRRGPVPHESPVGRPLQISVCAPLGPALSRTLDGDLRLAQGGGRASGRPGLARGVLIRGKVAEEGTGRPVAGAMVSFGTRRTRPSRTAPASGHAESGPDGSFQLAVLPSPGYLSSRPPARITCSSRSAARWSARVGRAAGGSTPMPSSPTTPGRREAPEVTVALRRGVTVKGRLIGPDDRPVQSAVMIGRSSSGRRPAPGGPGAPATGSGRARRPVRGPRARPRGRGPRPLPRAGAQARRDGPALGQVGRRGAGDRPPRALRHGQGPAGRPRRQAGRRATPAHGGHDGRHARGPLDPVREGARRGNRSPMRTALGRIDPSTTATGRSSDAQGRITCRP